LYNPPSKEDMIDDVKVQDQYVVLHPACALQLLYPRQRTVIYSTSMSNWVVFYSSDSWIAFADPATESSCIFLAAAKQEVTFKQAAL